MNDILRVFIALFVVMEPFASLPVFLKLTKHMHWKDRNYAADKASLVATITLVVFTILGPWVLAILGVTIKSYLIAGGVMLFLIATQFVLGLSFAREEPDKLDVGLVLIAVPLITGPGAMTTAILLSATNSIQVVVAGALFASLATWLVLRFADRIHKLMGVQGEEILTRLMGLLLGSIAVEFIRRGWLGA